MTTDVIVLGAGPAGLAAAHRLATRGVGVTVLEAAPVVGGLAGSFKVGGVRVDYGSHRLHPSCSPEVLALMRRLLGADLQRRPRRGRIRLAGRWVAFPVRAADLARNLPPRFVLGAARDALSAPFRTAPSDTFADVLRAGLGPTLADGFYFPYARKIWGLPPEELAGELARRRVGAGSPGRLLGRLLRRDPDAGVFYYPRRGFGEIVERLADAAATAGARIELGVAATAIAQGAVTTPAGPRPAAAVLSTLPLTRLVELASPAAPAAILDAARTLEYRGLVLVYLVVERPRYTDFDAHYFPESDVVASRVSEPTRYRDGSGSDPPDRTVVCAEVPCSPGDEVWRAEPVDLALRVADDLERSGLPRLVPVEVQARRVANAYPCYRVGFAPPVEQIEAWSRTVPGVLTFGRQGLFAHDNTHHALAMGRAAAAVIGPDGYVDRAAWAGARDAFRAHVVED